MIYTAEEAAFRSAIKKDPQNDAVRLAFADWLSERDRNDRAEFIRNQIYTYSRSGGPGYGAPYLWPDDFPGRTPKELEPATIVYYRGFPSEVAITCEDFADRSCRCRRPAGRPAAACETCKGTGIVTRSARDLCAHPLTRIILTNKDPYHFSGGAGDGYRWNFELLGSGYLVQPDDLPVEIWRLLDPMFNAAIDDIDLYGSYPTRQKAQDALSAACIAYGNQLLDAAR